MLSAYDYINQDIKKKEKKKQIKKSIYQIHKLAFGNTK